MFLLQSSLKVVSSHFIEFPSLLYNVKVPESDLKAICFTADFSMNYSPIHFKIINMKYRLQNPCDPAKRIKVIWRMDGRMNYGCGGKKDYSIL